MFETYLKLLGKNRLFNGLNEEEILSAISCLGFREQRFGKKETIFKIGDDIEEIAFILEGKVEITREDFWGNKAIIAILKKGELFGEVYACSNKKRFDNNVFTIEDSLIMFIKLSKIINVCSKNCGFHNKIVQNLVQVIAERNLNLNEKITCISERKTKDKILAFLSDQAKKAKSNVFFINFNRQQMADYLSVDRSALSSELSKLKKEGLISFNKNKFELL